MVLWVAQQQPPRCSPDTDIMTSTWRMGGGGACLDSRDWRRLVRVLGQLHSKLSKPS